MISGGGGQSLHPPQQIPHIGHRPRPPRSAAASGRYAITRIGWIRQQQEQLRSQAREAPRSFVGRETHYLWGRRHLLRVMELDAKPEVKLDHRTIHLQVRPGTSRDGRAKVIHAWHLKLLQGAVPPIIDKWESRIGVKVHRYFLRQMATKWGSCNSKAGTIRLNTELVKKPRDLLEYVIVHEMVHISEPTHSPRFFALLSEHYPSWPEARRELNELPVPQLTGR